MNYLAHAYLSFGHEDIMIGNLISDFVKGKKKFDYPLHIQNGITLHRSIDTFTDEHSITKQAKQFLKPAVGLYAGAFIDIVYDHFLALDQETWKENSLSNFSQHVYQVLEDHYSMLPEKFQRMFPYMKQHDWLYHYRLTSGIQKSFEGVTRRAVYLNNSSAAFEAFMHHYEVLKLLSQEFLSDVKKFVPAELQKLLRV